MDCFLYDYSFVNDETEMVIYLYGLTMDSKSVCVRVHNFKPWIYLELPDITWSDPMVNVVIQQLRTIFYKRNRGLHIDSYELVKRKKLYYAHLDPKNDYKDYKQFYYIKVRLSRAETSYRLNHINEAKFSINGKDYNLKVHEHNVDAVLKFMCVQGIGVSSWVTINSGVVPDKQKLTRADIEFKCNYKDVVPCSSDITDIPQPLLMVFDLEVYSSARNTMPSFKNDRDEIFQISCVFSRGSTMMGKFLLTRGEPSKEVVGNDVEVVSCKCESVLIRQFVRIVKDLNPQVITGWNITGFDFEYLVERAKATDTIRDLKRMCVVRSVDCEFTEPKKFSSSAYGSSNVYKLAISGRVHIDLLTYTRRHKKFSSYKLDNVAMVELNRGKDDISPSMIFDSYEQMLNGEYGLLGEVGHYCIVDSVLVHELFNKFDSWVTMMEMAKVTHVRGTDLYTKGQQVRVYNQVVRYSYNNDIVVESNAYEQTKDEKYKGATVVSPVPDIYHNVVPFDFKSLYPSIIIAYNIDYSTLVIDDNIPDHLCHIIEWSEHVDCEHTGTYKPISKKFACSDYRYRFLKEPKGVIPSILQNLLDSRARTRKQLAEVKESLKTCTDHDEIVRLSSYQLVLDTRQESFKISSNSAYGTFGVDVSKGMLPLMAGAMSVTAVGRQSIAKAITHLTTRYNAKLVYGDTDSNYVQFSRFLTTHELWEYAESIQQEMLDEGIFPEPMMLQFEDKVYEPFLILTKKRYIYKQLKRDGTQTTELGSKGSQMSRRDNSVLLRNLYADVAEWIFQGRNRSDILNDVLTAIIGICTFQYNRDLYVITKKVGDLEDYKKYVPEDSVRRQEKLAELGLNEETYALTIKSKGMTPEQYERSVLPAQVQLAEKMRSRGCQVDVGDRVAYVVVEGTGLERTLGERLEDDSYQRMFSDIVKLDYLYYIKSMINPLDEIISIALKETDFVMKLYKNMERKRQLVGDIKNLFKPRLVFEDEECIRQYKDDKKKEQKIAQQQLKAFHEHIKPE